MNKTKEFYDAEMERLLGGNDSTTPYVGKREEKEAPRRSQDSGQRGMRFDDYEADRENDSGVYDDDMERLMGGGSRGTKREGWKRPQKKGYGYGGHKGETFEDFGSGYGTGTGSWKPQIHDENKVEGFGGWFFRGQDQMGDPVIRLVMENMTASEISLAEEWYGRLGRMSRGCFLHRAGTSPMQVDGYTVFDFEITPQTYSLGELYRRKELNNQNPDRIMAQLNELIMEYCRDQLQRGEQYRALNCLTLDTVFVDPDNRLLVLPIYYNGRNYPVEIAREAILTGQKTDERSDLYAAAYVAVEVFSDSNGDKPLQKPESPIILACLQVVPGWRPTPQMVKDWYDGKRTTPRTKPGGTPRNKPIRKPSTIKWIRDLMEWVHSWKGLEEPEDPEDTDDTAYMRKDNSKDKGADDGDDSWYDYGEK